MRRPALLLLALLALTACPTPEPVQQDAALFQLDAGPLADVGSPAEDAAALDAARPDGSLADASVLAADAAQGSDAAALTDASALPDAGTADGGSKAANCASQFGNEMTNAFARIDGTVLAVVTPADTQCAIPNGSHLVLQVLMRNAAYRVVVNMLSDGRNGTDTKVRYLELHHALVGEPWSEGWHTGVAVDYPSTLGVHVADFTPVEQSALIQTVSDRLVIGAHVSAFSTSSGGYSSHLVHRNDSPPNTDGAVVIDPDSADPLFLLFYFDGQTF